MNFRKILLSAVSIMTLYSCANRQASPQQAPVAQEFPTAVVRQQSVELTVTYPAIIRGQQDVEIRPRIDGFIESIHIDEGSPVRKGQSLFRIDSPMATQGVATAQAAVTTATANVNSAKLDVDRMRPLAENNIISQVQLQSYQYRYEAARAALVQAEASLAQAQAIQSWTNVTSPVDGVAGSVHYRLGSLVSSGNVLTTIANTGNVFAYFSVNEKTLTNMLGNLQGKTQAEKIKSLPPVTFTLADGTVYSEKGRIETISGVVNTTTGSSNLRAAFPNPEGHLRSGSSGKVTIPNVIENAMLVPQKATFSQQNKTMLYKVQGDSVVLTLVTVLPTPDGKNYAVTSGLSDGDRVVTDGIVSLSNGKKITVKE